MDFEQIKRQLEQTLSKKRFEHSVAVSETAARLARHYGGDETKALLAGLVHDCVKEVDHKRMIGMCADFGLALDEVMLSEQKLIHARLGAEYAKRIFGIKDDEIYDAVYYHTTAKANMPLLTKIIYVADFIEPNRTFECVDEVRAKALENLDLAILDGLDYTINKMVFKKRMLHPETVNARNYMIQKMR
ncbi:MAG: bis(5'-nucleosyl)-tetraphosphatase (symmetrical) YqeK [Firmicutes bacterium]|nr:bis(5'-nucleosyl)-tetraphosphatase (symmetrical) YqeK [Bacillota bacterium]